jgi:TetR/AcrR family transcriptional regulator
MVDHPTGAAGPVLYTPVGMSERGDGALGVRALRTRQSILDAASRLFLDLGYAGTRINNITDACGISRAGFYTYFDDKREVFNVLGESAYRDVLEVIGRWERLPVPCALDDVVGWVREYFGFMDVHGAFIFASAHSAPNDEQFRATTRRIHMKVASLLGTRMHRSQVGATRSPEALGLATMALLDHSWFNCRVRRLPVEDDDMIRTVALMIFMSIHTNDRSHPNADPTPDPDDA